ncbi:amino acid transporter [Phyllosticta citribraziliensis]|uniref:Amino acid transporter n=1 Tax=Phyllosticta citribraziliensis TaxID=989973 RepID=A0ABR1LAN2_9PEZI
MGPTDQQGAGNGNSDLAIRTAAPIAAEEGKTNDAAPTHETRSSTSNNSRAVGEVLDVSETSSSEELGDAEKGKQSAPPYTPTEVGEVNPFGHEDENAEMKYQTMSWWQVGLLMVAENISLGVLSLPNAVATIGLVPGIILTIFFGLMAMYCGYVVGQFFNKYPSTHTFADAAYLMGGPIAREIMGVAQVLIIIFIMGAHVLSFSIALNVLTGHGTCTIVFGFVGFAVCLALALKRQLEKVSYLSIASCLSVVVCVLVAMIDIAIIRPEYGQAVAAQQHVSLQNGMLATLQIILAFSGHHAFFTFCAELRDPRDFTKSVVFMEGMATIFYVIVGVVIYIYAGPDVLSPALGSASPLVSKIAFGLALPTIVIAGVVNGHVACKYIWVRMWRNQPARLHQKYGASLISWIAICTVLWVIAWIIAEAIPSFSLLISLISALFCSWFSFGFSGFLWLYMNRGRWAESWKKMLLTALNVYVVIQGAVICGLGLYASGEALAEGAQGSAFSCADNSG